MKKLSKGFTKEFDTSQEAWAFMVLHNDNVQDGCVISIPYENSRKVLVRLIEEKEKPKRDRTGERDYVTGVIRDTLPGGINGIINHADGKRYDSKSEYTKAVKAKGCEIVGNDMNNATWKPPIERGVRGDFNVRPQLKEAIQRAFG